MREICRAGSGTFRFGMGYIAHRSATLPHGTSGFLPLPRGRGAVLQAMTVRASGYARTRKNFGKFGVMKR